MGGGGGGISPTSRTGLPQCACLPYYLVLLLVVVTVGVGVQLTVGERLPAKLLVTDGVAVCTPVRLGVKVGGLVGDMVGVVDTVGSDDPEGLQEDV